MSDMRSEALLDEQLDLITQYLNSQLDAKRAEEVRRRLETDREFLQLAAPLLLAWDAMRNGRPARAGESEKRWDEFTRKADFQHHRKRRKARRLWIIAIAAIVVLSGWYFGKDAVRRAYVDARYFRDVPVTGQWTRLPDSTEMLLSPGARASISTRPLYGGGDQVVRLEGEAQIRIQPPSPPGASLPQFRRVRVETRGARVFAMHGEFRVIARGDTTDVHMLRPTRRSFAGFMALPTEAFVFATGMRSELELHETEVARAVRGQGARKLVELRLPERNP